jgi:hypothetical protein
MISEVNAIWKVDMPQDLKTFSAFDIRADYPQLTNMKRK